MTDRRANVDRRRTDTRDRLVAVALEQFARKGYARTTVADLEQAVGLRPGAGGLYRHFRSKEELLLAAVEGYTARVRAVRVELGEVDGSDGSAGARRRSGSEAHLRRILVALTDFLSGEQAMVSLSAEGAALPDAARRAVAAAWDEGYGILADHLVVRGVEPVEARVLAVSALGELTHYVGQVGAWGREPLGVPLDEFVAAWVDRWSTFA